MRSNAGYGQAIRYPRVKIKLARLADVAHDRIERLQAVAGYAEDLRAIRRNFARGNEAEGRMFFTFTAIWLQQSCAKKQTQC